MASIFLRRVRATLNHVNVRKEGPEDALELACDLKLVAERVPASVLRALVIGEPMPGTDQEPSPRRWDVLDAFFDPVDGKPKFHGLPVLSFDEIRFPAHFVAIDDLHFRRVTAQKFRVSLVDRETVKVEFSVTVKPADHELESLSRRLRELVHVRVEPEQGDLFDATVAAASAQPRGDLRVEALHALSAGKPEAGQGERTSDPEPLGGTPGAGGTLGGGSMDDELDPLLEDAVTIVRDGGKCSQTFLQRRLKIGYNRAARIVEQLEKRGVIGPLRGDLTREVLPQAAPGSLDDEATGVKLYGPDGAKIFEGTGPEFRDAVDRATGRKRAPAAKVVPIKGPKK